MSEPRDYIDEQIIQMRQAGASLRLISQAVKLSEGGISHRIRRMGLPLLPTNPRKIEVDAEVAKRRAAGQSLSEIAEAFSVDTKVIHRRAVKLGLADPYEGKARPRRRASSDHTAAWAADQAAGMTAVEIAAKHGASYKIVWAALRRREMKRQEGA